MNFDMILERMAEIHKAKNADYGNSYELATKMLHRPVVEVLLSRMADKLARTCRLAAGHEAHVKDEGLADTLIDLANYAALAVLAVDGGCNMAAGNPIACVSTNKRERLQFDIQEDKGHKYVDIRLCFQEEGKDTWTPRKKGITVAPRLWVDFIGAIYMVTAELIKRDLVDQADLQKAIGDPLF